MNVLTITVLLLSQLVSSTTLYCPSTNDLEPGWGSNDVTVQNQGWTIVGTNGGGAAATKASFNLINGYVSFTIALAAVNYYVNANIYAIFPSGLGSSGFPYGQSSSAAPYCDGQGGSSYPWCPELDFIESNGNCAGASTIHAVQGTSANTCDSSGCQTAYNLNGVTTLKMNITFDSTGVPSFFVNGAKQTPTLTPPSSTGTVLTQYFTGQGAVIYSSMWQGWSPTTSTCTTGSQPWGSLSTSSFSISSLQIYGTVVQGPAPTVCSGQTAAPATTTKAPATTTKAPTTQAPAPPSPTTTKVATTAKATTKAPTATVTTVKPNQTTKAPATTTKPPTATPTPASSSGAPTKYDGQALGSWSAGRSTFYGVGNGGDCGYGNLPTSTFAWDLIAAPNQAYFNNAQACGQCFEIYCVSTWAATSSTPNYCIKGQSVIVQVTDYCPSGGSGGWCNGDIVHLDLSTAAFSKIVTPAQIGTVGVISTQYRRTACPASGNIMVNPAGGNSQWYQAIYFTNIADYGSLASVAFVCSGTSYSLTQQNYNAWVFSGTLPAAPSGCAIKITDTTGQVLTSATGIVPSWSTATAYSFGSNFKNPASEIYTQPENTSNKPPVTTITVAVVVGVVGILLLIGAIYWTLRTKQRRNSAPYRQESVAMGPSSAPTEAPTTTGSELVVAPTSVETVPRENYEDTRQKLAEAVQVATMQQHQPEGQETPEDVAQAEEQPL